MIGSWIDPEKVKRWEVGNAYAKDAQAAAFSDFDRTAAELAGPDETLRRILSARLRDAYMRGYRIPADREHFEWEWEFARRVQSSPTSPSGDRPARTSRRDESRTRQGAASP